MSTGELASVDVWKGALRILFRVICIVYDTYCDCSLLLLFVCIMTIARTSPNQGTQLKTLNSKP